MKTIEPQDFTVLVVDDNPVNIRLLASHLKSVGYAVRIAPNGDLAVRSVKVQPPDLILLDVLMPDMNGYEVCAKLKEDEALRDIPVIFVSALNATFDKVKAFDSGGVDYVTKPFQLAEVESRVATHLELVQKRRQLQASLEELRRLESLREQLVHMIVHDIRSPLTVIVSSLELLMMDLESVAGPQSLEDLSQASAAAERIRKMISNLLDVSRMEAGQMVLQARETDLEALIEKACGVASSMDPTRKVALDLALQGTVSCDPGVMERVIENLLTNAVKHTPEGTAIAVRARRETDQIRIEVADQGPGIPEEQRGNIFNKFATFRAVNGPSRPHSAGLGLAFCKLAIEAHGGSIDVSVENETVFWLTLPLPPA